MHPNSSLVRLCNQMTAEQEINTSEEVGRRTSLPRSSLKIYFKSNPSERRPYTLQIEGSISSKVNLSPIRTATLLVLLLDMQDRSEGGKGLLDPVSAMIDVYTTLGGRGSDKDNLKSLLRVALYRLELFCDENKALSTEGFHIHYSSRQNCLSLKNEKEEIPVDLIDISISADTLELNKIIHEVLDTSPLARVRKAQTLFLPGGSDTHERLVLEFFDHGYPVRLWSLLVRPALHSYPRACLERMGLSEQRLRRAELVWEGYRTGRVEVHEFLNRKTLHQLMQCDENGFSFHGIDVDEKLVAAHIRFIIDELCEYEGYNLWLTDAEFPFLLGAFEILSGDVNDKYLLFEDRACAKHLEDISCMVVNNPFTFRITQQTMIRSVIEHPSSTCDKDIVKAELEDTYASFLSMYADSIAEG